MKKRLLSALLALCLMLSLMPEAWASGGTADPPTKGDCGTNVQWILSGATLTIYTTSGTGTMAAPNPTWDASKDKITTVEILNGVTNICDNAFSGLPNLTSITIPSSVTTVGTSPLVGCSALKNIHFSGTNEQWDAIKSGVLDNVTTSPVVDISNEAPSDSGTCGPDATWMISEDPNTPGKVTLTILGKGPIVIENGRAPWSASRDKITDVIISDDVTAIGGGAFAAFPNLKTVLIPDSVTTIEGGAFAGIPASTTVRYTGDENQWKAIEGSGKNDIASAGITPVYNYRPVVLTFTRGEAEKGTSFQRTTIKGSSFRLPSRTDAEFIAANFVPPTYVPPGSTTTATKEFRGWLLTVDGKEMVYPEGYPLQVDGDTTFEAWWDEPSTGTNNQITFRHKFNDDPQLFEKPALTPVTFNVSKKDQILMVGNPAKDGYDFLGWTTLQDRNTLLPNIVVPGGRSGTLIYIANWKGKSFKVMVQEEGGADFSVTEYVVSPVEQKLTVKVPVADGMIWEISSVVSSGSVTYENAIPDSLGEATIIIPADVSGDIVVQGKFEPNSYDITWDANGGAWGTGDAAETTKTKENAYTFDKENDNDKDGAPDSDPTRRGYELSGWDCEDPKVTSKKEKDGTITVTIGKGTFGDLTLTAQWEAKKYPIIWNANGGTWGQDESGTEIVQQDGTYTIEDSSLTQTPPTREGWTFAGWKCTDASGKDVAITQPEGALNTVELPEGQIGRLTMTAQWKKVYTIKFDPGDGGDGEMKDKWALEDDEYPLPDCGFTPPASKQFAGWEINGTEYPLFVEDKTDPDNPTTKRNTYPIPPYTSGDAIITLTALWEDIQYTVTYVADNGTEEPNHREPVVHGKGHQLLTPTECKFTTPTGKAFLYWKVEGQTRKYQPGDILPNTLGDLTVTAVWGDEEYTVTFDGGGGSGTMAPEEGLTYNYPYTLPECAFTPPKAAPDPDPDAELPEYVFVAWEIEGQEYLPGSVILIQKSITAKAIWVNKADLVEYTLSYAPGGGTGTMEADTFYVRKAGVTVAVPLPSSSAFTFADMEFDGWQVGGTIYKPGESAPISGDTTATALWRGRIVYVDGGNVTEPTSYRYSDSGQQLNMNVTTPVKPGFIFKEWTWDNEDVALYGHIIDLPGKFSGTLTLTGHWTEDEGKYLITFDPNGGTGTMDPVTVDKPGEDEPAARYELPACGFEPPEGMAFDCWLVGEAKFQPGEPIPVTGHTTVIAQWKKKDVDPDAEDCVVTYLPGEGAGDPIVEEGHKVGEWLTLPECTFTAPEGKEFDAWDKGAPGEEVYLDSEAVTITALWKDKEPEPEDPNKPWTITFDAGGGTGAMSPVTVPKAEGGATYTLPACAFTAPEGKTFQAWKFDGQEYAPGAVVTINGDTTITAVWKAAEVKPPKPTSWKITYNLNGGYMSGSGPASYNLSDQAQTLNVPVPYKSGYTFLGWTYSGVSKPTKSVIIRANMTGDLTVVANWQMNPGAGGSNNTSQGYYISVSATAGGEIIIPWEYANQGATVSVQARPQPGYEVGSVTVVNSQGFEVGDLRDLGGGNYSFTMPGYRVNVSATFKLQSAAAGPISRPVMNYEDVRLGDWYYDSVEYVYNRGMMSGVSATQFGPNGQATRGAIWTALAAHAGFDINGGATWYERGQYWAVNRGITDGESPSGNITREQLVTMLWRYKGSPAVFGGDLWQFSDGYAVSPYAMDAMCWAVSTGLMGGANGRLNPQASTTRAEAATILARFCQS